MKKRSSKFFHSLIGDTEKSLQGLNSALALSKSRKLDSDVRDILLDGAVKRFETLFTKSINLLRFALSEEGIETLSPKQVVSEAVRIKWIKDRDFWLVAIDARSSTVNRTSDVSNSEYLNIMNNFSTEIEEIINLLNEDGS